MTFEVLTAVLMKIRAFLDAIPRLSVNCYKHFDGPWLLPKRRPHSVTFPKAVFLYICCNKTNLDATCFYFEQNRFIQCETYYKNDIILLIVREYVKN